MPNSISFRSTISVPKANSSVVPRRSNPICPQSQLQLQLKKNPWRGPFDLLIKLTNSTAPLLALNPTGSPSDPLVVHSSRDTDDRVAAHHELYATGVLFDNEVLVKEAEELMERLEIMAERVREELLSEITKGKIKGSDEEKRVVEMMSRDFVDRILEKPFQYMRCGDERLEVKVKDLKRLVRMFEQKVTSSKKCPFH